MPSSSENDWLSRAEAALYARLSVATIDRAVRTGKLESSKPPGVRTRRFRRDWIDAWLAGGHQLLLMFLH